MRAVYVGMVLGGSEPVGFIATTDLDAAGTFYLDVLDLEFVEESPVALVVRSGSIVVRITPVETHTPQPFTVLGWSVDDVASVIDRLLEHGVSMERYDFAEQDQLGIWAAPGGALVAWFKDPDGNVLSVVQG